MHLIATRTAPPTRSPHHSPRHSPSHQPHPGHTPQAHPVPIPPPHPTELHHANALRYKHLYGFTGSPSSPTDRTSGEADSIRRDASETTDASEASHVGFLVENPGASNSSVTTTTTTTTTSSSIATDDVHVVPSEVPASPLRSSKSPASSTTDGAVFPLSGIAVGTDARGDKVHSVSSDPVSIEDMAAAHIGFETPSSEGIRTPRQERHFIHSSTSPSRLDTVESSSRIHRTTPRPTLSAANAATVDDPDEFRCVTCHHAGLCAELVMKDPSFTCGNTMTSAVVANVREKRAGGHHGSDDSGLRLRHGERPVSVGAAEKTPWTGQRIERVIAPSAKKSAGLRVLQGGIDYVTYDDDGDGSGDKDDLVVRGKRGGVADMEDLGRAIRGTSLTASPLRPISVRNPSSTMAPSHRPHSTKRHSWNDIRVEYPASSSASTTFSTVHFHNCPPSNLQIPGASSGTGEPARSSSLAPSSSSSSKGALGPGQRPLEPNCITLEAALHAPRSRSQDQQRTHLVNPLWALRDATGADVLRDGGQSVRSDEEQYDHDDELYGIDVVERGRRRLR